MAVVIMKASRYFCQAIVIALGEPPALTRQYSIKGSARKPIKVEAGPYQALYLQHAAFPTNGLSKLSLLIQGSAPDGEVRLFMLTDGKVNGEGKLVKLANTGWTQVVVPLVTLGAEDKLIDGIWVQNATGGDLPRFYVTEIRIE